MVTLGPKSYNSGATHREEPIRIECPKKPEVWRVPIHNDSRKVPSDKPVASPTTSKRSDYHVHILM